MDKFEVVFKDPFKPIWEVEQWEIFSSDDAIAAFEQIDWAELLYWSIEDLGDLVSSMYYYGVLRIGHPQQEQAMLISGKIGQLRILGRKGPLLEVVCSCPSKYIAKGNLEMSHTKKLGIKMLEVRNCTIQFARKCLIAYLNGDNIFIRANILENNRAKVIKLP